MAYYRVCPHCGANIDRGERCDCRREQARKDLISAVLQMSAEDRAELLELWKQKKAALELETPGRRDATGFDGRC